MTETSNKWAYLGAQIKELRKRRRLTQVQMAVRCGLTVSTVSRIEMGHSDTSVETLVTIAHELRGAFEIKLRGRSAYIFSDGHQLPQAEAFSALEDRLAELRKEYEALAFVNRPIPEAGE